MRASRISAMLRIALTGWRACRDACSIRDLPGFVIVAWLHASGYVGALLGLVVAIVLVRRDVALGPVSVAM